MHAVIYYVCSLVLVLMLSSGLCGCRAQRSERMSLWRQSLIEDSLVAIRHAAMLEAWLTHMRMIDSSRMVVTRYDTAGRVLERVEYQADKRTEHTEQGHKQEATQAQVRAGHQAQERAMVTSRVESQQEAVRLPQWVWWVLIVSALVMGIFVSIRLIGVRR